ncbi:MAG: hypothetical protein JW768_07280 [Chitinispirillaceae bacterium]|nr:hypothetical protein [Chitinispirillaceae bacterium]
MRLRSWAIVTVLLLIAVGSALYELKLYVEKKRRLETLIVEAVAPYSKGSLAIGSIRFGFFSAHLKKVSLTLPAQALAMSADEITVTLSLRKLVSSRFNVAQSISNIILVKPLIEYSIAPAASADSPARRPFPVASSQIRSGSAPPLEVEYLQVKKGTLLIKDHTGTSIVLGEELHGRLRDNGKELTYDLDGRLGASRKNLFASGSISWTGSRHHLSLRFRSAEIKRPISLKEAEIVSGTLTGALEFSFPDSFSLASLESNGWIRITRGTCRIDSLKKPFDSVNLSCTFNDSRCTIDSIRCSWSGVSIRATGSWDLARRDATDRLNFECRNITLDSLPLPVLDGFSRAVSGTGWLFGTLKRQGERGSTLSLKAGGVNAWGTPVHQADADVTLNDTALSFDALKLRLPGIRIGAGGSVDLRDTEPAYSFSCRGAVDSLGTVAPAAIRGTARFSGTVQGTGDDYTGRFTVQTDGVSYADVPLCNLAATVHARGTSAQFNIQGKDSTLACSVRGRVDSLFSSYPITCCSLALAISRNHRLLHGCTGRFFCPDTLSLVGLLTGTPDHLKGNARAEIHSPKIRGDCNLEIERSGDTSAPVFWRLRGRSLRFNSANVTCDGSGRLYPDSAAIDSMTLLDAVFSSGKIIFSDPPQIRITSHYRLPIKKLLALTGKDDGTVESGDLSGTARWYGPVDAIETRAELHARDVSIGGFGKLHTDAILTASGGDLIVLPLVLRKDAQVVFALDTIRTSPPIKLSGRFDDLDLRAVFGALMPEELSVAGKVSGTFRSSRNGFPISVSATSATVMVNRWRFDSIAVKGDLDSKGIRIVRCSATDGSRSHLSVRGYIPLAFLQGKDLDSTDTLGIDLLVKGDIIKTMHSNLHPLIDGSGRGTIRFSASGHPDNLKVKEASLLIPKGRLLLRPYVPGDIKDFSCAMSVKGSSKVHTILSGSVRKRPLRIFSIHQIPSGFRPIVIGPLNFGIIQAETPQRGIDIHIPRLMVKGETGDVEVRGKRPLSHLSLSGPVKKPHLSGIIVLRDIEFTYPPVHSDASEPSHGGTKHGDRDSSDSGDEQAISFVQWDLDIKAGNRKVMYFRDIANKSTRLMRFVEGYIDPGTSLLRVRGSGHDHDLKISGVINSYHGSVYYGKTFDRNFEVALEFVPRKKVRQPGYDNLPILSGNAEAFSDTSRFDRIKLTALIQDEKTGTLSERGRISGNKFNVVFQVSSEFEELPGASEREFYRQAGLQFTTLGGAGRFMSDFGEQYLHRFFLQRFERRLAKSIGLDVINIETSIASNYFNRFYNQHYENLMMQADYVALANVGVTVGRYFFRDNLFVKARGGLLPVDTALTPQYSFGLEFQPTRYIFMDIDYGFYKGDLALEHNPRLNLQLRLPITGLRSYFDF